jgi:hypothetical protein
VADDGKKKPFQTPATSSASAEQLNSQISPHSAFIISIY